MGWWPHHRQPIDVALRSGHGNQLMASGHSAYVKSNLGTVPWYFFVSQTYRNLRWRSQYG